MDERARRIGENEALFRSVNEQVRAVGHDFGSPTLRIVCECGEETCVDQLELTPSEYEAVRADSALFAIKPGHDLPDVETVVERMRAYWVVRKDAGTPERIARESDPRA